MSPFDLTDRVSLVTGAGGGLGAAIATRLGEAGSRVVCVDVDLDAARRTAASIGADAAAVAVDVRDRAAVHAAVGEVADRYGRLDALCNVAGVPGNQQQVVDLDEAELDRVLDVNLKGVFFGCQAALAAMTGQGSGTIVNMASSAIDVPRAGLAPYTMSKAAVAALTKVLAVEAGPLGVRVNAVAPGWVETPLAHASSTRPDGTIDEVAAGMMKDAMRAMSPLGRTGETDDVAFAFLYLVSDAARFVTGQTLRPNGGASMPW